MARCPTGATSERIQLAMTYVEIQERPHAALRLLDPIERSTLDENQSRWVTQLEDTAQQLIDEGVLELENQAW